MQNIVTAALVEVTKTSKGFQIWWGESVSYGAQHCFQCGDSTSLGCGSIGVYPF